MLLLNSICALNSDIKGMLLFQQMLFYIVKILILYVQKHAEEAHRRDTNRRVLINLIVTIVPLKSSRAWSRLDALEVRGARMDEWVRHEWLLWTREWKTIQRETLLSVCVFLFPPVVFLSDCAPVGLMCCVCACWSAATACTRGELRGFRSCAAKPAAPHRTSPSSPPRSRSYCLQSRQRKHTKALSYSSK